MTLGEEILSYLEDINPKEITSHIEQGTLDQWTKAWKAAAAGAVISALRPVSREQVENVWRGEWEDMRESYNDVPKRRCSRCKSVFIGLDTPFCEVCGAPMTDEAVQMVMERMEALHEKT